MRIVHSNITIVDDIVLAGTKSSGAVVATLCG